MPSPDRGLLDRVFTPQHVFLTRASCKQDLLQTLFTGLEGCDSIADMKALRASILERESLMSTGIGQGVGVPHARIAGVNDLVLGIAINQTPIHDYTSIDGQPIQMVFLIASRPDQQADYVSLLSELSHLIRDPVRKQALTEATSIPKIVAIIQAGLQEPDL